MEGQKCRHERKTTSLNGGTSRLILHVDDRSTRDSMAMRLNGGGCVVSSVASGTDVSACTNWPIHSAPRGARAPGSSAKPLRGAAPSATRTVKPPDLSSAFKVNRPRFWASASRSLNDRKP